MIEITGGKDGSRLEPQIFQVKQVIYREANIVRFHENIKYLLTHGATDYKQATKMLNDLFSKDNYQVMAPRVSVISLVDMQDQFALTFGTANFDLFSIYMSNLCSLFALKELFETGYTYQDIKSDKELISNKVKAVKELYLPKEVKKWRNKVAAHYAAGMPDKSDNIATIMQSINMVPTYNTPYYSVASSTFEIAGKTSQLLAWSLTEQYEKLRADTLSDCQELPPLLANHHHDGVIKIA